MQHITVFSALLITAGCHAKPNMVAGALRAPIMPPIIGGQTIDIQEFPYQAQFRYQWTYVCGGTIISETWVVTSARCAAQVQTATSTVLVGSASLDKGQEYNVKSIHIFNKFNQNSLTYDIALLQLSESIAFSETTQPAAVATEEIPQGQTAVVSGFGTTQSEKHITNSKTLLAAEVPVVPRLLCKMLYAGTSVIDQSTICAGSKGESFCQNDLGGPLVRNGVLVGVASHSAGCDQDGTPGIYTNVAEESVRDWIFRLSGI